MVQLFRHTNRYCFKSKGVKLHTMSPSPNKASQWRIPVVREERKTRFLAVVKSTTSNSLVPTNLKSRRRTLVDFRLIVGQKYLCKKYKHNVHY